MFKLVFFIFIFIFFIYCLKNKVHIRFRTFLQRGFIVDNSPFGIFCFWAKQGSGKSMGCVDFLFKSSGYPIYANLKSLRGIKYYYYSGLDTFLNICTSKNHCIIFFDEIFRYLGKDSKLSSDQKKKLKDALCQMRKRRIICITTCQEWLDMPIDFRRYVKRDIQCRLLSIFGYPILIKKFYDTTQIKWSNIDNEYISPILGTYVEHGRKKICDSYDTLEVITDEEIPPIEVFNDYNTDIQYNIESKNNNLKNIELKEVNNKQNDFVFGAVVSQQQQNKNKNNNILINFINKLLKFIFNNVKKITRFFTTTIKKRVVSCQFTNKNKNNKNNYTNTLHNNKALYDNDFWGKIDNSDLEQ